MAVSWKMFITLFVIYVIVVDGNATSRRRRRRAASSNMNSDLMGKSFNREVLSPNPQILNDPGSGLQQQNDQNNIRSARQGNRQYFPNQGQYGYGSVQNLNYPYAGAGVGSYQYGYGQYGQYGQGLGQYGAYYNQFPGSNSFYSGYNSGNYYNRPGYQSSYPQGGYGGYGGYNNYFWNSAQKHNINMFTILLSSILTLLICSNL